MKTIIKNRRTQEIEKVFEYPNEAKAIMLAAKEVNNYIFAHYGKQKIQIQTIKSAGGEEEGVLITIG